MHQLEYSVVINIKTSCRNRTSRYQCKSNLFSVISFRVIIPTTKWSESTRVKVLERNISLKQNTRNHGHERYIRTSHHHMSQTHCAELPTLMSVQRTNEENK